MVGMKMKMVGDKRREKFRRILLCGADQIDDTHTLDTDTLFPVLFFVSITAITPTALAPRLGLSIP